MKAYVKESIIDLYDCDPSLFTRTKLDEFFDQITKLINVEQGDRHYWDYAGYPEEIEAAGVVMAWRAKVSPDSTLSHG